MDCAFDLGVRVGTAAEGILVGDDDWNGGCVWAGCGKFCERPHCPNAIAQISGAPRKLLSGLFEADSLVR